MCHLTHLFSYSFTLSKFQNKTFYGLGGKYRNNLTFLYEWTLPKQRWLNVTFAERWLRWGDMEIWVHQKTIFVQFEIYFSISYQPLWFSVVGQVSWICSTLGKFRNWTFSSSLLNFLAIRISLRSIRTQIRYAQLTKIHFRPKRTKNTSEQNGQKNTPCQQKSPFRDLNGGGGGIRTHGTLARTTVFKTAPINRSGTPPKLFNW